MIRSPRQVKRGDIHGGSHRHNGANTRVTRTRYTDTSVNGVKRCHTNVILIGAIEAVEGQRVTEMLKKHLVKTLISK